MKQLELCITSHCNLCCSHCYQHLEKNKYELPFEKIINILKYAIKEKVELIVISGGEASLHPKYYDILNFINSNKIECILVTNGTSLNYDLLQKLNPLNFKFVMSIDGKEKNHDIRRGEGNYRKTLKIIKKLQKIGFKIKISTAIDSQNYKDVSDLLNNKNFHQISFMPVGYAGAAKINNLETNNKNFEETIKLLYDTCKNQCSFRECIMFPKSFSVNYDGYVYPCSLARDFKILEMGNIYDKEINEIINQSLEEKNKFYNSENKLLDCDKCDIKNCSKGCRIRALKFFGNLYKADPFACKLNGKNYLKQSYAKLYWGEKE